MISYLDLAALNARQGPALEQRIAQVIREDYVIRGAAVRQFEEAWSSTCGVNYAVGTNSGLDALTLILRGYIELGKLQPGDPVIVPSHTFIATWLSVLQAGLTPVPVDVNSVTYNLEMPQIQAALTNDVKAIVVVHLYGCLVQDLKALRSLCDAKDILLVADAAQAHGAKCLDGSYPDSHTHASSYSFYPGKNLGALGDAGAVVTDDFDLATMVSDLGNYGSPVKYTHERLGINSRMDTIQAAVLHEKLQLLQTDNLRRRELFNQIVAGTENPLLTLPQSAGEDNVCHIFPVLVDDTAAFIRHMESHDIMCLRHYPIACQDQAVFRDTELAEYDLPVARDIAAREVSIPCNPLLTDDDVSQIIQALNSFP